jgi:hypothetical protein
MELYSEYVIGYRMWRVREGVRSANVWKASNPVLMSSLYTNMLWPYKKANQAVGEITLHGSAGFYAYKNTIEGRRRARRFAFVEPGQVVVGPVALWGKVVVHKCGYRAEYAYPLELRVMRRWHGLAKDRRLAEQLEALYGIPVKDGYPINDAIENLRTSDRAIDLLLLVAGSVGVGSLMFLQFLILIKLLTKG